MKIAGIDYSMTSPSVCVFEGDTWDVKSCKLYYMVKSDKKVYSKGIFKGFVYPKFSSDQERFHLLAEWSKECTSGVEEIGLEGYAFGAVGRTFQISENTGVLKQKLWEESRPFRTFAPTEVKKFATGKGNADKQKMFDAFYEETKIDVFDSLSISSRKNWNPVSDIIDAYYIAKLLHHRITYGLK